MPIWSDNEASTDLLRFRYLSEEVTDLVTESRLLPITVGVYGDWGSGKSTLIRMIEAEVKGKANVLSLQFNGWLFEGYEDAKTALMGTVLDALDSYINNNQDVSQRAKDLLGSLVKRVKWLEVAKMAGRYALPALVGLPHLSLANIGSDVVKLAQSAAAKADAETLTDAAGLLQEPPEDDKTTRRDIREFRNDFEQLLKEAKLTSLVVFIDDLDRCLPDTVIETLEAIKLFLFVPGTAFVIGADERLIQYAVRERFPELPGTEVEVGRDYLEKLVQVPVRIPPLGRQDVECYMNLLFAELQLQTEAYQKVCAAVQEPSGEDALKPSFDLEQARKILGAENVPLPLQDDFSLTMQVVPVLLPALAGNPRRAKRFLNTLMLRLSLANRRGLKLERRILAKLMELEYIRPIFFRSLAELQLAEEGKPQALRALEDGVREERLVENQDQVPPQRESDSAPDETGRSGSEADDTGTVVSRGLEAWLGDRWTQEWLASEPKLANVDLGPYFFIAHDKVGPLASADIRLTPAATEVLNRLLSTAPVTRALGIRQAAELSVPDALAIFQELAERIRQSETLDGPLQPVTFDFVESRPELLPQLVGLYQGLPEGKILVVTPPTFVRIGRASSSARAIRNLLEQWSRSTRMPLASAAKSGLDRLVSPT